jgi:hypothetical protein
VLSESSDMHEAKSGWSHFCRHACRPSQLARKPRSGKRPYTGNPPEAIDPQWLKEREERIQRLSETLRGGDRVTSRNGLARWSAEQLRAVEQAVLAYPEATPYELGVRLAAVIGRTVDSVRHRVIRIRSRKSPSGGT